MYPDVVVNNFTISKMQIVNSVHYYNAYTCDHCKAFFKSLMYQDNDYWKDELCKHLMKCKKYKAFIRGEKY